MISFTRHRRNARDKLMEIYDRQSASRHGVGENLPLPPGDACHALHMRIEDIIIHATWRRPSFTARSITFHDSLGDTRTSCSPCSGDLGTARSSAEARPKVLRGNNRG
ncbi:hypothetical protein BaRGS_00030385 [Batillaria attramentaria]|uniref:Uncharacterized protein n=1 Tax=Batillaria attramentaria TaxID=370345 RepID=A0ABD0JUB1_9CAEN